MSVLNALTAAVQSHKEDDIKDCLKVILSQGTDIELKNREVINKLLKYNTSDVTKLTSEVIAELAKVESNRSFFTDLEIINSLLSLLQHENEDVVLNAIRALGNICYDNEKAGIIIDKSGFDRILAILKADCERSSSIITTKASGFLLNVLNIHEGLPKTAVKSGITNLLEKLLSKYRSSFNEDEALIYYLLAILNITADYMDEQNVPFTESLLNIVIELFKLSPNPSISVTCTEIFHGQSEKDEIKSLLAKQGVCELLFELIEKHRHKVNDEDSRSVLKMACDLIVIILTGDDCMYLLYENGKGKVYENMITWLDSDDPDLLSTGVLAIGNFARKDVHCIQMVKDGLSKKLITILSKYNSCDSDIKIQHALLSTLKNLIIPQQNKAQVLQEGLIDVIYPMIKIDQYLVVFKLLGTFRMIIDGQEPAARDLISRTDFLGKIVYWCYNSDHLGVRGEVPRLLAWLIKNCHSFKPFQNLLSVKDCIKCLVDMISSNHAVMQNEAFYALNLLCIGCSHSNSSQNGNVNNDDCTTNNCDNSADNESQKLYEEFINAEIGKNLQFVINKYGDKMDKQTIDNLLTLLEQLIKSKIMIDHLKKLDICEALNKLLLNATVNTPERINNIVLEVNKT